MVEKWKTAINPKNNDDKCFWYAIRGSLNIEQVEKELQRSKEYQKLSLLLINIIGNKWVFRHLKMTGKSPNKVIN